jgi:hypothetical protein
MSHKKKDPSPEEDKEFNNTLKRMLNTPPKPKVKKKPAK